jgi:phosphatidylglycerophosphatase A
VAERITPLDRMAILVAELGPLGRLPKAPGTWGSAAGALLAPVALFPLDYYWRALLLAGVFILGTAAAAKAERALGRKDPGGVVIDELVGQWATLAIFPQWNWWLVAAGFILFRLFDIFKPWPIKRLELKLGGGLGVMADDVLAAVYAAAVLLVLARLLPVL